jgi:hypothetical protein
LLLIASQFLNACLGVALENAVGPTTITFYKRGYVEGGTDITSVTNAKIIGRFGTR